MKEELALSQTAMVGVDLKIRAADSEDFLGKLLLLLIINYLLIININYC